MKGEGETGDGERGIGFRCRDVVWWFVVMVAVSAYAQVGTLTGQGDWEETLTPPFTYSPFRTDADHLGAEVFNVAEAIYTKGAFADPFGDATGPTAWVAPLLPSLLAAGLLVTGGSKVTVTVGFYVLQCVILAVIASIVTAIARSLRITWAGILAVLIVGMIHFQFTFQITHDGVMTAGVLALLMWAAVCWLRPDAINGARWHRRWAGWGVVGGIAALTSPVLALVWIALACWRLMISNHGSAERSATRWFFASALIATLVSSPWVIRNAVVFGKLIPTKSNAGFELYQSLHDEPTGVVTRTSMGLHPYSPSTVHGRRYREVGEIAFVAEKSTAFRKKLAAEPLKYFDQVAARLEAATWRLPNWLTVVQFSTWHGVVSWLYPLIALGFVVTLFRTSMTAPLVIGRELESLESGETDGPTERSTTIWIMCSQIVYVTYLTPYVLVSFYERYAVALWLPSAILIVCLADGGRRFRHFRNVR